MPAGVDVEVLSSVNGQFQKYYRNNNIAIHTGLTRSQVYRQDITEQITKGFNCSIRQLIEKILSDRLKQIIYLFLFRRRMSRLFLKLQPFDAIHFHYISPDLESRYKLLTKKFDGKVVLTYWGSDLLRSNGESRNKNIRKRADSIVCVTKKLTQQYLSFYGNNEKDKIKTIGFGVSGYELIDQILDNTIENDFHDAFFLPKGKIYIAVGYNAAKSQQHSRVIESILSLPKNTQSKLHLILQYSYNYSEDREYYEDIERKLSSGAFTWSVIDQFLNDAGSASLKCGIDIFVHAQVTDSLSASMLEYIYCGAVVINGSWLQYPELEMIENKCLSFDDFSTLSLLLDEIVNGYVGRKRPTIADRRALRSFSSWDVVGRHWLEVYS